jgi:hypothetical protein
MWRRHPTAPVGSVKVPVIVPVSDWANALEAITAMTTKSAT